MELLSIRQSRHEYEYLGLGSFLDKKQRTLDLDPI